MQRSETILQIEQNNDLTDSETLTIIEEVLKDTTEATKLPGVQTDGQLVPEKGEKVRPAWQQSEIDAKKMYPDYRPQMSFDAYGNEVKYGTKGSSVEVKNYLLQTDGQANSLVNHVVTQYNKRNQMLPTGTQQIVLIDIRGQDVPRERIERIQQEILSRSGMGILVVFKIR